jgi:hypothetical protein
MMIVFLGPSLPLGPARAELDAIYRGPVAQGDVYRAVISADRPEAIGIIDGQFDHVPAVWHKEILWAMAHGVPVYGSASMGALRAAELHAFGMEGVGAIFEWYRDDVLEDDDEVAVVHGPAETAYRPMSESMVNIRCTLRSAERAGIITPVTRSRLETMAKAQFFPERSYQGLIATSHGHVDEAELEAFAAWWPNGRVDQKRDDALAMLRLMRHRHASDQRPSVTTVRYRFAHTVFWQHLIDEAGTIDTSGEPLVTQAVLDELWLEPETCVQTNRAARDSVVPSTSSDRRLLVDELRRRGHYDRLAARAADKQRVLRSAGLEDRGEANEADETDALLAWYAEHGDRAAQPDDAFLALARAHWAEFLRALVREQHYARARMSVARLSEHE